MDISSDQIHGSADIEFLATNCKGEYKLQVAIIENLQIRQDTFIEDSKQQVKTNFCVKNGQKIIPGELVAQTSLISKSKGKVENITDNGQSGKKFLFLEKQMKRLYI